MGKIKADLAIGILANVAGILNLALGYRFLANYFGWNAFRERRRETGDWTLGGTCHNYSRRNRNRYRMGKDV
jgi:hypothetical protein